MNNVNISNKQVLLNNFSKTQIEKYKKAGLTLRLKKDGTFTDTWSNSPMNGQWEILIDFKFYNNKSNFYVLKHFISDKNCVYMSSSYHINLQSEKLSEYTKKEWSKIKPISKR